MRTVTEIKRELDGTTERRGELWRMLSREHDALAAAELTRLNSRITALWEELRIAQTRERFGSPEPILRRADREKRLEREFDRAIERHQLARAA